MNRFVFLNSIDLEDGGIELERLASSLCADFNHSFGRDLERGFLGT